METLMVRDLNDHLVQTCNCTGYDLATVIINQILDDQTLHFILHQNYRGKRACS